MKKTLCAVSLILSSLSSFASGPGGGTLVCEMPYYESRHSNGLNVASNHGVHITNDTNKSYTYHIYYSSSLDQGNGEKEVASKHISRVIEPGQTFSDQQQISGFFSTPDKGHFKTYAKTSVSVHDKNIMAPCVYKNKFRSY